MTRSRRFFPLLLALLLLLGGCQNSDSPSSQPSAPAPQSSLGEAPSSPSPPLSSPTDEHLSRPAPQPVEYLPHGDFVWEVRGGESTVFLMGTMHILKPEYALTPEVVSLLAGCDALAVESDTENPALLAAVEKLMYYDDETTLFDHLSARGQEHIRALCDEYGLSPLMLATYRPFMVSSLFTYLPAPMTGFGMEGVDAKLMALAREQDKELLELEDARTVYARFNSLDDDTLERTCILPIPFREETAKQLEEMYRIYLAGDAQLMTAYLREESNMGGDGQPIEFQEKDDLYSQYMLTDRNRVMADSILSYLSTPDRDVFVAAGLAHFLDEGSIIDLLGQAGYQVARLDITPGVPGTAPPQELFPAA